jgi:hypothetical protein
MTALPQWANTRIGRACIAEIIANPPEGRLVRDDWGTRDQPEFNAWKRPDVATLKRLHREWKERELARLDQRFERTGHWDHDAANAIFRMEDADALIGRVLAEAQARSEAA